MCLGADLRALGATTPVDAESRAPKKRIGFRARSAPTSFVTRTETRGCRAAAPAPSSHVAARTARTAFKRPKEQRSTFRRRPRSSEPERDRPHEPASRRKTNPMQAESPENQTPVALSPNAMAQRDMNAMPAHVPPVSVGKKPFDARYAREIFRVNGSRTHRVGGDPRVVALSRIRHRPARGSALTPRALTPPFHPVTAGSEARRTPTCPPRASS